jgi:hypothetical protein
MNDCLAKPVDTGEYSMQRNGGTTQAPVTHQQVAAQTNPMNGNLAWQGTQEGTQIREVAWREPPIHWAADMPGSVARHRLVSTQATVEFGSPLE